MVKLTSEILEDIQNTKILPLSTCSLDHIPNVVPIGIFEIDTSCDEKDFIYIMNNFFLKTMNNILENPFVSFYVLGKEIKRCTQIKGKVIEILQKGEIYDKYKQKYLSRIPSLPCKHILKIEIISVYNCKSGSDAGKKIL